MKKQELDLIKKVVIDRDIKDKEEYKKAYELLKVAYNKLTEMGYEFVATTYIEKEIYEKALELLVEEKKTTMTVYKTLAKNEYGEYRVIEQEAKNKTAFIRNLRANGYRVSEMKVKTKEIFNRASELIDYVSSVEEAETIWKNIKSIDDTVETITERAFGF